VSTQLLPQAFWFRLAVPCRRIDGLPRGGGRNGARLLDLPAACRLPTTGPLDGQAAWADVRVAWNPEGLAVAVEAIARPNSGPGGGAARAPGEERPDGIDGLQVWVDTRDTRDVSRATRFCHRFTARLRGLATSAPGPLAVDLAQRPIARAIADAPTCRPELLAARAERLKAGWRLELFLPAAALHGFDPETNRRLGFAYQVSDPDRGADQFLGVGREFPVGENPSLWSTLELREPE
jgi:hypothetical protein